MSTVLIFGRANMGLNKPTILADSAVEPTFEDYINFEQCIPSNLDYRKAEFLYYEVNSEMCIIEAQPKITLSTGEIKYFLRWEIGTLDNVNHNWYYKKLPIHKGMDPFCVAVYGQSYFKGKTHKISWLDL
jgi:hypothetical protein